LKFILFIISLCFSVSALSDPSVLDFRKTSVRIYNPKMSSGGTGSIIKSSETGSKILTNKHVCRLIEQGGWVNYNDKNYKVTHYKKFKDHDLCLLRIDKNLNVNTTISDKTAKIADEVYVSGHPNLLPHILTKGHLTDKLDIELVVGLKKCKKDDLSLECLFFGGLPVVQKFESQVVSNLIKPGSSGSAVFNTQGEIVGVIFAGSGRDFSYGFIVPQKYIHYFLAVAKFENYTPVGTPVSDQGLSGRVFNYDKCRNIHPNNKINSFCKRIKDNLIWRK
jgi:S1-C subfamily serine protease